MSQGLTNNLEDVQRALEGLTEAIVQEREDNATARAQNEALQAVVNALQVQMASVGPGGPAINAMQMQPPPQEHIQPQQQGQYYNNRIPPACAGGIDRGNSARKRGQRGGKSTK